MNKVKPIRPPSKYPLEIRQDISGTLVLLRRGKHRVETLVLTPKEVEQLRSIIS